MVKVRYVLVSLSLLACGTDNHDKDQCVTQADCLDGYVCTNGTCEVPTGSCTPLQCGTDECGALDDGCGGTLQCGACPMPDHCTDGHLSGNESDVDCGGDCPTACGLGSACNAQADCATGTCDTNVCLAGAWTQGASMPTERFDFGAAVSGGVIYAIGGYNHNGVVGANDAYDPAIDSWTTLAPMPTPRYGFAAVVVASGDIWTIGGQYSQSAPSTDGNSVKVEIYHPATNTWTSGPNLPDGRYLGAAAYSGGRIYAYGGFTVNPILTLSSVVSIAPGEGSWSAVSDSMTKARNWHAGASTSDGKIFAIAGYDDANDTELATIEYYQPGTPGWHTLPPMQKARKDLAAAVLDDKIYVIGGNSWLSQGVTHTTTVEVFDPATSQWSVVTSEPAGREGAGAVTYNGKIYVLGGDLDNGQSTSNPSSSIDIYTP